jgi:hypothetical protein
MDLPFSSEQFFDVFGRYNTAIWPAQLALVAMALGCLWLLFVQRERDRVIGWALALLWAWMAVVYHFAFFARINPAAGVFGAAFLLAAGLFAWHAHRGTLRFSRPQGAAHVAGLVLVAYALVGYPLVGSLAGHNYPRTPTFGLPCPTTIFTLGFLLLARRPAPVSVFVVPLVWTMVGTAAAVQLGVVQDYGLVAAAAVAVTTLTLGAPGGRGGRRRTSSRQGAIPSASTEERSAPA